MVGRLYATLKEPKDDGHASLHAESCAASAVPIPVMRGRAFRQTDGEIRRPGGPEEGESYADNETIATRSRTVHA